MKRFKYCALVTLEPPPRSRRADSLPETGGRVVVQARHHETRHTKIFSALVANTPGEALTPAGHAVRLTMTVLGDDAGDYLDSGDSFTLWRGHQIGHGVISRRLFLWTNSA